MKTNNNTPENVQKTQRLIYKEKLEQFLNQFPDDATSWQQATDEIRDLARSVRLAFNEMVLVVLEDDPKAVPAIDFTKIRKPGLWNEAAKTQIRILWDDLPTLIQDRIANNLPESNEEQAEEVKKEATPEQMRAVLVQIQEGLEDKSENEGGLNFHESAWLEGIQALNLNSTS